MEELCEMCLRPITDPVCENCYLKQIESWLDKECLNLLVKVNFIKKIRDSIPEYALNEEKCILCNSENIKVCRHCFFLIAANKLLEMKLSKEAVTYFENMFNVEA